MTEFQDFTCPECSAAEMSQRDFRIHLVQKHPTTWLAKRARQELAQSLAADAAKATNRSEP